MMPSARPIRTAAITLKVDRLGGARSGPSAASADRSWPRSISALRNASRMIDILLDSGIEWEQVARKLEGARVEPGRIRELRCLIGGFDIGDPHRASTQDPE